MWWTVTLAIAAVAMAALVVFVLVGLFDVLSEPGWDRAIGGDPGSPPEDSRARAS